MKLKHRLGNLFLFAVLLALLCLGGQPLIAVKDSIRITKATNKHLLIITSQPYVTQWFTTLNNSLVENLYANLTMQIKLSYEYIDSKTLWTLKEEPYSAFFSFAFLNNIAE